MKYVIVGTGGTGGCIGASLASGGQDVTFIARGDHLHTLRESGLYLESDLKGMLYIQPVQACTTEEYDQIADVILVCVKFYSLSSILPLLQKASDEHTVIIPILNVYGTGQLLSQQLPGTTPFASAALYHFAWAAGCQIWQTVHYDRCAARRPWQ